MRKINMYIRSLLTVAVIALTALPAIARDQINIVGSSTVFPFSTTVAERFGKSTAFKTPVVESTVRRRQRRWRGASSGITKGCAFLNSLMIRPSGSGAQGTSTRRRNH